MYLKIKQKLHFVLFLLGCACLVWWGCVCKIAFHSFFKVPILHYLPYFAFFVMIGMSILNWIKLSKKETLKSEMDILQYYIHKDN